MARKSVIVAIVGFVTMAVGAGIILVVATRKPAVKAPTAGQPILIAFTASIGGLYLRYARLEELVRVLAAGWRKAVVNVDYSPGDEVGVPYWGPGDFGFPE